MPDLLAEGAIPPGPTPREAPSVPTDFERATVEMVAHMVARLANAVAGPTPEAMDATTTAKFLGVSRGKVHQLNTGGLMPAPVELGDRCPRWIRSELIAWLRAGAPSRPRWLLIRDQVWRRAG